MNREPETQKDSAFSEKLCWMGNSRGMKKPEFARFLGISEKKLYQLEHGFNPTKGILARIHASLKAKGCFAEAEELMACAGETSHKPGTMDSADFYSLANALREADERVLKSIRDHNREFFSEKELAQEHLDLLEASITNGGLDFSEFMAKIQDARFLEKLSQTIIPQLRVHLSDVSDGRFSTIQFAHNNRVLLTLKDADLLWPCWCKSKITNEKNCPIHSNPRGKEVENRFLHGLVEICWRGFRFLWRNGREAWPPSVDAFIFIETLEKKGIFRKPAKSVLDAGSGTGFLGIIASHLGDSVTEIILWDWLLTPALYGQINWYRNRENKQLNTQRDYVVAHPVIALFPQTIQRHSLPIPLDLVLCNPPYLPIPEAFKKLSFESTTSGTVLLEQIISNSRELGENVYVQFSNLALVEAKAYAEQTRMRLLPIGKEHPIPCRIRDAINNAGYLRYLRKPSRGLTVKNHKYMHKVRAYKIV